jgi:hypothetical protein
MSDALISFRNFAGFICRMFAPDGEALLRTGAYVNEAQL